MHLELHTPVIAPWNSKLQLYNSQPNDATFVHLLSLLPFPTSPFAQVRTMHRFSKGVINWNPLPASAHSSFEISLLSSFCSPPLCSTLCLAVGVQGLKIQHSVSSHGNQMMTHLCSVPLFFFYFTARWFLYLIFKKNKNKKKIAMHDTTSKRAFVAVLPDLWQLREF